MNYPEPWNSWDGLSIISNKSQRSALQLAAVIAQFDLERCPRYQVRDTTGDGKADTFCNIFAWDWSRAMRAELPHWVNSLGTPASTHPAGVRELSANGLIDWLHSHGQRFGWVLVDEATARLGALVGRPSVVTWKNPKGSGHIAVVRPAPTLGEAQIAQAGGSIFQAGSISKGFGVTHSTAQRPLEWWAHE